MVTEKPTAIQRVQWGLNLVFHNSLCVITVFILWTILQTFTFTLDKNNRYPWHVLLSTIAYIPLMGEAIILFSSDNLWTLKVNRTTRYWIHGCLLMISGVLATVGIFLEVAGRHRGHFKSEHAWTGFVSWIFVMLSQFLGLLAAKPQFFSKVIRPVYIKFIHNLLGLLGYVFGIVSLAYGLKYLRLHKNAETATFYVLGFVTAWSIVAALKSGYHQLKGIVT